jgi:hypothetical protein
VQRVFQLATFGGEVVFDSYRSIGNHSARYQSFAFERAEAFGEHSIRYIGNSILDSRIASASLEKRLDNSSSPAPTDELNGSVKAGANG